MNENQIINKIWKYELLHIWTKSNYKHILNLKTIFKYEHNFIYEQVFIHEQIWTMG
jgi:hypothetical protein